MKNKLVAASLIFSIFLLFTSLCSFAIQAGDSTWNIQTVDQGYVGWDNTLVLDSSGNPHISYYDERNHDLKYASWTGSAWNTQTVDQKGDVGQYISLALDSKDNPHISYIDTTNGNLKYANLVSSGWSIQTVAPTVTQDFGTALALDSKDNPHISYWGKGLMYASWTGSTWNIQAVDLNVNQTIGIENFNAAAGISLVLDSKDNPHISYCALNLMYASWKGPTWNIQTLDSNGDVKFNPSLVLDSAENPHISYQDYTSGYLMYASLSDLTWNIQAVDSIGYTSEVSSIALDSLGNPHISYCDFFNDTLRYASLSDSKWNIQSVDPNGYANFWASLALDSADNPHLSYFDDAHSVLKYAELSSKATITATPVQTPDPDVFNVQSNSTITAFAFDSQRQELSFNVTGPSGTTGYANVTVAKSYLPNHDKIKVFIDKNQVDFGVSETADSWILSLKYSHSTHLVRIGLLAAPETVDFLGITLAGWIVAVILVSATLAVLTAIVFKKKRK
jgi:hypothetical protein